MPIKITFSELDSHATCPWQWWQKYVRLQRPKKRSVKLSFGSAIHKGIEAFYGRDGDPVEVVKTYCAEVMKQAVTEGVTLSDDYELILKKAEHLIRAYVAHYKDDLQNFNVISVEPTFEIPLVDDIWVTGKMDRIVVEKRTGLLHPVETKTAASWDNDVNRLMLDFQVSVYSWAFARMLKVQDVTFIYDVLKKPALKQKANETEIEFLERIAKDINVRHDQYFIRDKVTRSKREIERTEKELIIRCRELVERRKTGDVYRTSGDHCHWKCDFMPPCLEDSQDMWEALYYTETNVHPELTVPKE